jgi:hypothetical protein
MKAGKAFTSIGKNLKRNIKNIDLDTQGDINS